MGEGGGLVTADPDWLNDSPGLVLEAIDGFLAHKLLGCPEDCAGNPCDPDPEMLLTVTGTSGTINWCGQTWVLPGDSGVEKSVCPTFYAKVKAQSTITTFQIQRIAYERWRHDTTGTPNGLLRLSRFYGANGAPGTGGFGSAINDARLRPSGGSLAYNYRKQTWLWGPTWPTRYSFFTVTNTGLGLTEGATAAFARYTNNDYLILDSFFGSHVIGGVTYSWARGAGW